MAGLWRFTRNRYGRAVYDALTARGVTATWMCEYVRRLDTDEAVHSDPSDAGDRTGDAFTVGSCDPACVTSLDAPVEQLLEGERVVAAFDGDTPLGYLFLSVDATHDIEPLERSMTFEGAYVRRVFVAPAHRQRGVASGLLRAARRRANEDGASRITALVALDNAPSRGLFEKHGFEAVRDYRYVRAGPFDARSRRDRQA
jgi:ribosomal protein S18 acetylase RimI-like enzyme